MKPANQVFNEFMSDAENNEWYYSRPESIRKLIEKMPWETFIVNDKAPHESIACPGQKVHLVCYVECQHCGEAFMKVVVKGPEKTGLAKFNEAFAFTLHTLRDGFLPQHFSDEPPPIYPVETLTLQEVLEADVIVKVDPDWLDPAD